MPRVTEILDYLTEPELVNWYKNSSKAKCEAVAKEALRIGTAVDILVREDVSDGGYLLPEGDEAIANCMQGWEKFKKDYPDFVESVALSQVELERDGVVGHPDFLRDGQKVTDLKTSSGIRPKYFTQCAAYGWLWLGGLASEISVLRLDKKEGKYEYVTINSHSEIAYQLEIFQAYRKVYEHAFNTRETLRAQLERELLK